MKNGLFFWNLSSNLQWSLVFLYVNSLYASIFLEYLSLAYNEVHLYIQKIILFIKSVEKMRQCILCSSNTHYIISSFHHHSALRHVRLNPICRVEFSDWKWNRLPILLPFSVVCPRCVFSHPEIVYDHLRQNRCKTLMASLTPKHGWLPLNTRHLTIPPPRPPSQKISPSFEDIKFLFK